ncbi:SDR family oxidoreductase [Chryseobacterium sediminis]|uniref:SDR family NAD(P)-dependent oxidoreductase n=1 Tax=Chryseobacterium sediminis TaxID=1679494 RepID=UPI00285B93DF|nr:SDR family oxidoreductase [Chryseobacterium sediminis]MDR6463017.1 NAD(P)-dependent dehydrogenase (short-subunit alcohol dehydrogenase family) [Chryseobacterium sediminis]
MRETVLLTGATAGIGEEIAVKLSEVYDLILTGRNIEKLNELKSKLSDSCTSHILALDLSNLENTEKTLVQFLNENSINVHKLVHCAGFMKMIPLKLVNNDFMMECFTTNVFSANLLIKLLVNKKINNSLLNSVVFISSNISNRGAKAMSTYGASKSALDGLMRNLAVELAPRVRINSVLPGAVLTKMTQNIFDNEDVMARMQAQYPLGIGYAKDIADAVNYLLSDDARWITGQQITVDGGRSINISS